MGQAQTEYNNELARLCNTCQGLPHVPPVSEERLQKYLKVREYRKRPPLGATQ
jgi:hypothetical protein